MSSVTSVVKRSAHRKKAPVIKTEPSLEQGSSASDIQITENIKMEINNTSLNTVNKKSKTIVKKPRATSSAGLSKAPKPKKPKRKVESFVTDEEKTLLPLMRGRIERARREKLYVISRKSISPIEQEFEVTGSTGNLYTIRIGPRLSCACSDFRIRRRHCKHILMILLKMFRLPASSPIFQTMKPNKFVLQEILANHVPDPSTLIPEELKILIDKKLHGEMEEAEIKTERRPLTASDCPVCCDSFEDQTLTDILFCLVCGNNIHKACFDMWKSTKGSRVSCVYCRSPWEDPGVKKKKNLELNHEGFANFGRELGLSAIRDTSTYRAFPYRDYYYY